MFEGPGFLAPNDKAFENKKTLESPLQKRINRNEH